MFYQKYSPFTRMVIGTFLGCTLGIIFGLFFGFLIKTISLFLIPGMFDGPHILAPFLGMGFGAIIGSILGAIYSNK